MKTGLPRQDTVMACPSLMGVRSTSMEASAWVEASGFIWLDERPQRHGRTDAREGLRRDDDEIATVGLFRRVRRQVSLPLHLLVRDRRRSTDDRRAALQCPAPPAADAAASHRGLRSVAEALVELSVIARGSPNRTF